MGKTEKVRMIMVHFFKSNRGVLVFGVLYVLFLMAWQWGRFTRHIPMPEYENMYAHSQYVLGEARDRIMGDEDVYTYAGALYAHGTDPTLVNFEHPPLAKYLFGWSYLFFGSPNWFQPVFLLIGFFSFWSVSQTLLKRGWSRWLAVCLWLFHSVVYLSFSETMLDFLAMNVSLMVLASFLHFGKTPSQKSALLWGVVSGVFLAIKYPIPTHVLLLALLWIYALLRFKGRNFLWIMPLTAGCVYVLTYVGFFAHSHTILDWAKFEWWRWKWYSGKTATVRGQLFQLMWKGWYTIQWKFDGSVTISEKWNMFWPMSFLLYCTSFFIRRVYASVLLPYFLWLCISLCLYYFGAQGERFMLPLVPGFALFGALAVEELTKILSARLSVR